MLYEENYDAQKETYESLIGAIKAKFEKDILAIQPTGDAMEATEQV